MLPRAWCNWFEAVRVVTAKLNSSRSPLSSTVDDGLNSSVGSLDDEEHGDVELDIIYLDETMISVYTNPYYLSVTGELHVYQAIVESILSLYTPEFRMIVPMDDRITTKNKQDFLLNKVT